MSEESQDQVVLIIPPRSRRKHFFFVGSALFSVALVVFFWSFMMKGFIVDAADRFRTGDSSVPSVADLQAVWDKQRQEWADAFGSLTDLPAVPPAGSALQDATAAISEAIMRVPSGDTATSDNALKPQP